MAGPLDCNRQGPLMLGTGAGLAAGLNLSPLGCVPPQPADILIVDSTDSIHAKAANLPPWKVAAATTKPPATWATLTVILSLAARLAGAFPAFHSLLRHALSSRLVSF